MCGVYTYDLHGLYRVTLIARGRLPPVIEKLVEMFPSCASSTSTSRARRRLLRWTRRLPA